MTDRPRRSAQTLLLVLLLTGCSTATPAGSGWVPDVAHESSAPPSTESPTPDPARSSTRSPTPDPARSSTPGPTQRPQPSAGSESTAYPLPARPSAPEGLAAEWGIAYLSPEGGVTALGTLGDGAAWSTIKVPLSVAALREQGAGVTSQAHAALSWSDNAAAAQLWAALGPPDEARAAVDEVLRSWGDATTTTQTTQVRPPFSAFGQTSWSLEGQVRAARGLDCAEDDPAVTTVLDSMGQVVTDQSWGLGRLDGSRFKGGWGPGPDGRYLVRQFGLVHLDGQAYPVAVAARAEDGTLDAGARTLDVLAGWWAEELVGESAPTGCTRRDTDATR